MRAFLIEYFTLAVAERQARNRTDEARSEARRALTLATEHSEAAETAWAAGSRVIAIALSQRALDAALIALALLSDTEDGAEAFGVDLDRFVSALARVEVTVKDPGEILEAREPARAAAPLRDRDVLDRHARRHTQRQRGARELIEALLERTRPSSSLEGLRRTRVVAAVSLALGFCLLTAWSITRVRPRIEVSASAYRTDRGHGAWLRNVTVEAWPPENAIDADEMTYWQLPAGETGWIELHLDPARNIRGLRVMNGHDLHADDANREDRRRFGFAAGDCVITALSNGGARAQSRVTLPAVVDFEYVTVPLEADAVDQIRVQVNSFEGAGGGIAEIIVLE